MSNRFTEQAQRVIPQIEKRESAFFQALLKKDTAVLNSLLSQDFILVEALQGAEIDKSSFVSVLECGRLKFKKIDPAGSRMRRYQNTAIVVGETRMAGEFDQAPFTVRSRYTYVYFHKNGSWQMVSAQGTPISPNPA